MNAIDFRKHGPPDVLHLETWPLPERKPGQVIVKMAATSVNPIDLKMRSGDAAPPLVYKVPKIPGGDVAGYVTDAELQMSRFKVGDRVFGLTDTAGPLSERGTYAQFVAVDESWLAPIPESLSYEEAGATSLVALTAYQAIEPANLQAGHRVLIHGGSGGVGHMAIQLAKIKGAYVVTTCSAKHAEFCKRMGADEALDYKTSRFEKEYYHSPFDAIIDSVGGYNWLKNLSVLKRKGYYGHIFNGAWMGRVPSIFNIQLELTAASLGYLRSMTGGARYKFVIAKPNGSQMETIAKLMAEGKLKVHIAKSFPLENASEAHRALEEGGIAGKIAISISQKKPDAVTST